MGKKNKTISCPYCGNQVIKESFLKDGVCGNPECGFDISNAPDVIEYFEAIQRKEDYSDVFGDAYTMKRTKNNDLHRQGMVNANNDDDEPNFSIEAPENIPDDDSVNPTDNEPDNEPDDIHESTVSESAASEDEEKLKRQRNLELLMQRRAAAKTKQEAENNTNADKSVYITQPTSIVDSYEQESPGEDNVTTDVEPKGMTAEEQIALLKAELELKQREIADMHRRDTEEEAALPENSVFDDSSEALATAKFEPGISSKELEESIEKKKPLSPAERIRMRREYDTIGSNEKLEKMSSDYDSNADGYYDDTPATVPPQPDIVNKTAIIRFVGAFVGLALLTGFLILWV